jgi:phosphoribosylanthranilate isomerase
MFRIKICGITRLEDVRQAVAAGADAIGLNFYPASPRSVSGELARTLAGAIPPGVSKVGVFVNSPVLEMVDRYRELQLDYLQLHGDETPELAAELVRRWPGVRLLRAVRCRADQVGEVAGWVRRLAELQVVPSGLLVDAFQPGQFGGTGQRADGAVVAALRASGIRLPIILAGGLNSSNVAEAVRDAKPDAVDTASGVEQSAGIKDAVKMVEFVRAAQESLAAIHR